VVLIRISFGSSLPVAGGLLIPATAALLHENIVPVVPLAGVYEKRVLEQIGDGDNVLVSVGTGFTTTTTS
jgi:hypothetical protein